MVKKKLPLSPTNHKTAFWYKVSLYNKCMYLCYKMCENSPHLYVIFTFLSTYGHAKLHMLSIGNLVEFLSVNEQFSLSVSELCMLSCDGPNRTSSTTITESPSHVIFMESFSHSVTISSRMKKTMLKNHSICKMTINNCLWTKSVTSGSCAYEFTLGFLVEFVLPNL